MANYIVFIVALLFVPLCNALFDADAFCATAGGATGYYCHPDHTKYVKCLVEDGVFTGSVQCCEPNYHFSSPVKACVAGYTSDASTVQHCAEANFASGTKGLHPGMIGYACDPTNSTKFIICSANSTWAWNAHCPDDLHFDTTSKCVAPELAGCAPEANVVGEMVMGPTESSDDATTASDATAATAASTASAATDATNSSAIATTAASTTDDYPEMGEMNMSNDTDATSATAASAANTTAASAATTTDDYPEMGEMNMGNDTEATTAPAAPASSESDPGSYGLFSESVDLLNLLMGNGVFKASSVQLRRMLLLTAPDNTASAAASNSTNDAGAMRMGPWGPGAPAGPGGTAAAARPWGPSAPAGPGGPAVAAGRPRITCRTTYLYHPEKADWGGAKDICEYEGGQLAVITGPIAQRRIANTFGQKKEFWIGATDIEREGQFRWVNGESWKFSNWYKSQPNPGKGQHCLTFNYWGKDTKWGDRHCLGSRPFLCEIEVCRPVRRRFPNKYPGGFKGPIVDWRRFPQNRNFPGARGRSGIATNYVAGGRGYPYDSQEDVRSTIHI